MTYSIEHPNTQVFRLGPKQFPNLYNVRYNNTRGQFLIPKLFRSSDPDLFDIFRLGVADLSISISVEAIRGQPGLERGILNWDVPILSGISQRLVNRDTELIDVRTVKLKRTLTLVRGGLGHRLECDREERCVEVVREEHEVVVLARL